MLKLLLFLVIFGGFAWFALSRGLRWELVVFLIFIAILRGLIRRNLR